MANDIRFEMTLDAVIELLESKKDKDGNSLFAKGEIDKIVKEKIEKANKAAKTASILTPRTGLVKPGSSLIQ